MYLRPIIMDCLDQNVILILVILQLWHQCDPQTAILDAVEVINATNLRHLWLWLGATVIASVFSSQIRWLSQVVGYFSGEQQIFSATYFFSSLSLLSKMSWSLGDEAFCKVVPRTVRATTQQMCLQIHQAWIVTDHVWDDNRKDQRESIDSS